MPNLRILIVSIILVVSASLHAAEFGDPSKFAIRFDDATGNLSEIVRNGKTVTLPVKEKQGFDISLDGQWLYGKHPVELVSMAKSGDAFHAVQKFGDWRLAFRYTVDPDTATLGRSVKITYSGKEPVKVKGFWFSYPVFPFEKDAKFLVPGLYPPKVFTPDNFTDGAKQGIWRNSTPFAMQLDKSKSVIMMQDTLVDYADRGGADASHRDGGIRLAQSFTTLGHFKPNVEQTIGNGYLRFVDGDVETALKSIHGLMRDLGHAVPKDRPKWFEEAITYSFHPGGTIGSGCKDLGGFVPATKFLDRIKELGVNTIWLMPLEDKSIYWPRDYYKFQDGLGSTPEKAGEEYKALVDRAHELGLKVLQDSVPHGGSNTYQRMIDHPEWLAQEEDGSTLHYWCADFNWPTWIDYMADVTTFYVKTYGIDGFRVDACGGSKIPNWNPAIPYARASHSQSQGGLNMLRAIRKAVKDQKPDGAILAEVQGSVFGAVSDAVYDFELAYNVLHDARKQTPEEFVKRIRRWLHEQQYSEIPDLLRLRHVESHDSLRAQLWYGTEPHRALMALTTFIHGIPLVYHEQETGHLDAFQDIFAVRKSLPELNGGDADYLCVDAPPGVFACLRTRGDDASIVVINFNDTETIGAIRMKWSDLPPMLRNESAVWCKNPFEHLLVSRSLERQDGYLNIDYASAISDALPFDIRLYVLRKDQKTVMGTLPTEMLFRQMAFEPDSSPEPDKPDAYDGQIKLPIGGEHFSAFVDPETGLLSGMTKFGYSLLGPADLFLPESFRQNAEKPQIEETEGGLIVKRKFGKAILEIEYSPLVQSYLDAAGIHEFQADCVGIRIRWSGSGSPKDAVMSFPIIDAKGWKARSPDGELEDVFYPRHLTTDAIYGSIYWRPQGTNMFFDSLLTPFDPAEIFQPLCFSLKAGDLYAGFHKHHCRVRFADRIGERQGPFLLFSIPDDHGSSPLATAEHAINLGTSNIVTDSNSPESLRPTTGGWIYENDHYILRLTRSGTIMSLEDKKNAKIVHQGDLYTDYGYGVEKMRYAAGNDVEAGCRIVRDGDVLRLRFEGQLRGFGRFDLMRPPVEYFTEYALSENSPAFSMAAAVKTNRSPTGDRAFLALMLPMPTVKRFEYFKDGKPVAEGTNVGAKGRSFQCRDVLPDRVLLKNADADLLELTGLGGDVSNLFLDRQNFFITFDDGENLGTPGRWRSFTATMSVTAGRSSSAPKVTATNRALPSQSSPGLLADGGFEAVSTGDLVSMQTGAVLKGERRNAAVWRVPPQGFVVTDVYHSGKSSAKVVGETAQYRHFVQDVAVKDLKPGQKLRLTAWVKGDDLKQGPESWQIGSVRFDLTADGKQQYVSAPALLGTFDWKEVSVEWTVPEKLDRLSVQVGVNGAAGVIWIDDVTLTVE